MRNVPPSIRSMGVVETVMLRAYGRRGPSAPPVPDAPSRMRSVVAGARRSAPANTDRMRGVRG
ncbi:hypothetical protein GCM10009857_14120 [Agromyces soli]